MNEERGMASSDPLDDLLSKHDASLLKNRKNTLSVLKDAYSISVPGLIAKSMTDRLEQASGVEFHYGTPEPELRRLASWLFTTAGMKHDLLLKLTHAAWNRHGREDLRIAGLILANLNSTVMNDGPWGELSTIIRTVEPLEALLEVIEEIARSGACCPNDEMLGAWEKSSLIHHHLAILVLHVCNRREGVNNLTTVQKNILLNRPQGPELISRIAERMLDEAS
jgi:hypothetical protein